MSKILVVYHTFTGNTEKMAQALAEGAGKVQGVEVAVKKAAATQPDELAAADGAAFGAPNTFDGMAGALREFFDRAWSVHEKVSGKPAAAFSSENPGEKGAVQEIERFFTFFDLKPVSEGVVASNAPGTEELQACRDLGRKLAEATRK